MTLPFDLDPAAAAFLAAAVFGSALVRGYCGFGFSALVIAAAALVTHPLHFVAVVILCEIVMTVQAWRGLSFAVDWWRVGFLMLGAGLGLPFGLWALGELSADWVRITMSAYLLIMCAILLAGWRFRAAVGALGHFGVGLISGLANAVGMGGLPVAAFFAAQPIAAAVFRATLVAYFPLLDLYSGPFYWYSGMLSWDTLWASVLALPFVFTGNYMGGRHFLKSDPQSFKRFVIYLLALLSLLILGRTVLI